MVRILLPASLGQQLLILIPFVVKRSRLLRRAKQQHVVNIKPPFIEQINFTAICLFVHCNLLQRRSDKKVGAPTDHLAWNVPISWNCCLLAPSDNMLSPLCTCRWNIHFFLTCEQYNQECASSRPPKYCTPDHWKIATDRFGLQVHKECVAVLIGLYKKNGAVSCVGFDFVSF